MDLELDISWLVVEILVETVGWLWRFKCFGDLSFTGDLEIFLVLWRLGGTVFEIF